MHFETKNSLLLQKSRINIQDKQWIFCPGVVLKEDSNYIFYKLNKSCATFSSLNEKSTVKC